MEFLENMSMVAVISISVLLLLSLGSLGTLLLMYRRHQEQRIHWLLLENSQSANIIPDKDLTYDESGLIPHCLLFVEKCSYLIDKLINLPVRTESYKNLSTKYIKAAIKLPELVEDFTANIHEPSDAKLLAFKADNLIIEINQLALLAGKLNNKLDLKWFNDGICDVEQHLTILHFAAMNTTIFDYSVV